MSLTEAEKQERDEKRARWAARRAEGKCILGFEECSNPEHHLYVDLMERGWKVAEESNG